MTDDRIRESHHIWLREAAWDQRGRATPTEQCLWSVLRGRQIDGLRFRRQHPIGPYVVDFLCFEARLVVEIDGSSHGDRGEYDAERDDYLEHLGYRVLRVPVALVQRNLTEALRMIRTSCMAPPLPRAGEGGGG